MKAIVIYKSKYGSTKAYRKACLVRQKNTQM